MTKIPPQRLEWVDGNGYEYESAKDLLLRQKAATHRNNGIENLYRLGRSKAFVQEWIKGYEGPIETSALSCDNPQHAIRSFNARKAATRFIQSPS